jgi:hypothetical protein
MESGWLYLYLVVDVWSRITRGPSRQAMVLQVQLIHGNHGPV